MLVYNVRPQAMARLQLGYDVVSKINPRLIYAGVFGFGQDGPYAAKPAYDDLIQGATALPALMAQTSDGVPRYVPNALVDRIVGLTAVGAICASLVHRDRTGRGQRLDIPMFETMAGFVMGDHMGGLTYEPPLDSGGYARHLSRDRRPYKTSDGYICVIVYNDKQWENFFKATGRDDLRRDPKFATFAGPRHQYRYGLCRTGPHLRDANHRRMDRTARQGRCARDADARSRKHAAGPASGRDRFLSGGRSSERRQNPQHEGVRDLVGDISRADAAGAAAQRARRAKSCSEAGFSADEIAALVRDGVTRAGCARGIETMDFALTANQELIRDAVAKICARFDDAYWLRKDKEGGYPADFHKALADAGWLGICIPEAYGGSGLGIIDAAIMMRTIAESGAGMSGASAVHMNVFGLNPVVVFGTEEQCQRMLPPIVVGRAAVLLCRHRTQYRAQHHATENPRGAKRATNTSSTARRSGSRPRRSPRRFCCWRAPRRWRR